MLPGAARAEVRAVFDRLIQLAIPNGTNMREVKLGDRNALVIEGGQGRTSWAYWTEGEDVVIAIGHGAEGFKRVVAVLEGEQPSAERTRCAPSFSRPKTASSRSMFLSWTCRLCLPCPRTPRPWAWTESSASRTTRGSGARRSRASTGSSRPRRRGVLTLIDQPTFNAKSLPPMPAGQTDFTVVSLDAGKFLDVLRTTPDGERKVNEMSQNFRRQTGLRLREDVLDTIGPQWAFFMASEGPGAEWSVLGGLANWALHPPKLTAVVQIRDREGLRASLKTLAKFANEQFELGTGRAHPAVRIERAGQGGRIRPGHSTPALTAAGRRAADVARRRQPCRAEHLHPSRPAGASGQGPTRDHRGAGQARRRLALCQSQRPARVVARVDYQCPVLPSGHRQDGRESRFPTLDGGLTQIHIDPDRLPDPDAMRKFLFPALTTAKATDDGLEIRSRMAFPGPSFVPMPTGPVAIALLLPAVQAAREAARRSQCVNNLKQIALAMHNYHSAFNTFPAAAIAGKDGKPLLSWRVAILPYIEQDALYHQFHLDEPWDSPNNKPLIEQMPKIYACPSDNPEPGMTHYQVIVGPKQGNGNEPGTVFEGLTKKHGLLEITDGTSNTLMIVEARKPVIWTQPEDVPFDPKGQLLPLLGSNHAGGFNTAFCDGSVRFIKLSIDQGVLKALATRNGGEVINFSSF